MSDIKPTALDKFTNAIKRDGAEAILSQEELGEMKGFIDQFSPLLAGSDFTELQKKAFSDKEFWTVGINKIIQGSTSSGKTLIAEFRMAYELYCKHKKVLYIVPLKALTTEKHKVFSNHFKDKRVYSSSSDYQEHDYDLVHGDYDIGVLVYEKFFSLLAQNGKGLVLNCSLVFVDEMHMLKDPERGPKVEFSINKFRNTADSLDNQYSIMGLTTIDCNMENVEKWLNISESIKCSDRPVPIEENFICMNEDNNGFDVISFLNAKPCGSQALEFDPSLSPVEEWKADSKKIAVLLNIIKNHSDKQIIIFCNGKNNSKSLLKAICKSGIMKKLNSDISMKIPDADDCEMDENQYNDFRNGINNYGIAVHNASLTLIARNFIEDAFEENKLRIIIATETLTMGVNLPTDIMIMYDTKVWRGDDIPELMSYQDYNNAIGRAGRLGKSKLNMGISYVITSDKQESKKLSDAFHDASKIDTICSGIKSFGENYIHGKNEVERLGLSLAPYYLSLINNKSGYTRDEINKMVSDGLKINHNIEDSEVLTDKLLDWLCKKNPYYSFADIEEGFDFEKTYVTNNSGKTLSPFALSILTYQRMLAYFVDRSKGEYKLPIYNEKHFTIGPSMFSLENKPSTSNDDNPPIYNEEHFTIEPSMFSLENKPSTSNDKKSAPDYFLDIIFLICRYMIEIASKNSMLNIDKSAHRLKYSDGLKAFLEKIDENNFIKGSALLAIHNGEDPKDNDLTAVFRSVVLYLWIQGYSVREIRAKLALPDTSEFYIYTSDVQSLGEICAYQLEAISQAIKNCFRHTDSDKLSLMFYSASIRVKYGMDNELAHIANKHIRGLTRSRLIKLYKKSREAKCDSINPFIIYHKDAVSQILDEDIYNELTAVIDEPLKYNLEKLEDSIRRDVVCPDFMLDYDELCQCDDRAFLKNLSNVFSQLSLKARYSSSQNYIQIDDGRISFFECRTSKELLSEDEVIKHIQGNNPETFKKAEHPIIIVFNRISDSSSTRHCCLEFDVLRLAMLRILIKSGCESGCEEPFMNVMTAFSEHGSDVLLNYVKFEKAMESNNLPVPGNVPAGIPDGVPGSNPFAFSTTINNFYGNTQINNTQNITICKHYITQFLEFKTQIPNAQSDEEIDRYLTDKSEELEKFAPIKDEPDFDQKCRNAYKNYVDSPEFDLLFDNNGYAKKQKSSFTIGLYLIDILDTFNPKDYSPSGIMIAKSLEEYLKDGFLKYLKKRYAGKLRKR